MTENQTESDVTPDQLMAHFKGRSLKAIITFTIVVHVVVLVGTSVPFLAKAVLGTDTAKMSEEERLNHAVQEANASLEKIAEEHGLKAQDLSDRFGGGKRPAAAKPETPVTPNPVPEPGAEAEKAPSAIEKEINVKSTGPKLPDMEAEEEDLFK